MNSEAKTLAMAAPKSSSVLFHETDGATHIVGLGPIKVIVCNEGGSWFAQGLDVDYAASGDSLEQAKKNFATGLFKTIDLHIKAYSNLAKFVKPAPMEVWKELSALGGKALNYTQISFHDDLTKTLGYQGINFIEREAIAA